MSSADMAAPRLRGCWRGGADHGLKLCGHAHDGLRAGAKRASATSATTSPARITCSRRGSASPSRPPSPVSSDATRCCASATAGLQRRLVQFRLTDPEPMLYHNEPILRDGRIVGHLSSGAYGPPSGRRGRAWLCPLYRRKRGAASGVRLRDRRGRNTRRCHRLAQTALRPARRAGAHVGGAFDQNALRSPRSQRRVWLKRLLRQGANRQRITNRSGSISVMAAPGAGCRRALATVPFQDCDVPGPSPEIPPQCPCGPSRQAPSRPSWSAARSHGCGCGKGPTGPACRATRTRAC